MASLQVRVVRFSDRFRCSTRTSRMISAVSYLQQLYFDTSHNVLGDMKICVIVCPVQCICIGQNIKSRKSPSVRPASVDKIVTLSMDRSSPNLEHTSLSSLYHTGVKFFVQFEGVCAPAPPLIDRHLRCQVFAPKINVVFAKLSCSSCARRAAS